jgi:hypothetical protein
MRTAQLEKTQEEDHRREERVRAALPVDLEGATGITRDVSASGIFLETDASCATGSSTSLAIDFDTPGGKMTMSCAGEIVRVEPRGTRLGIAVKILQSTLIRSAA